MLTLLASPQVLHDKFLALQTARDVADLLEVDYDTLIYHIYRVPPSEKYKVFRIRKRSGGEREISAPATALKILQRKLNYVLQQVYEPKATVHGFVPARSIVTNSKLHCRQRYVLNLDLLDFFPTINFGRVRGLFMSIPYSLPAPAATALTQLCCFNNALPQGAPTSPTISNMICARLDSELLNLAKQHRCHYTRYADDITFSTSLRVFPTALAESQNGSNASVGQDLDWVIRRNGFEVNSNKVRLQARTTRQEVTGLVTNRQPNVRRRFVRQIRAMLHAWSKFGLDAAEDEFYRHYDRKPRNPDLQLPPFELVVKGKIEFLRMVRGEHDVVYRKFRNQLRGLAPNLVPWDGYDVEATAGLQPRYFTEGTTDWRHLKAALVKLQNQGMYLGIPANLDDCCAQGGGSGLLAFCEAASKTPHSNPVICIFDRDVRDILDKVVDPGIEYKSWGNSVYSLALPIPPHRLATPDICIELCYLDSEITRVDPNGRRLFLNTEFNRISGKHNQDSRLNCLDMNSVKNANRTLKIIDERVFDEQNRNVALPKSEFATYVLEGAQGYDDFTFEGFRPLFDVIRLILAEELRVGSS